jgi:hypothetical protein
MMIRKSTTVVNWIAASASSNHRSFTALLFAIDESLVIQNNRNGSDKSAAQKLRQGKNYSASGDATCPRPAVPPGVRAPALASSNT